MSLQELEKERLEAEELRVEETVQRSAAVRKRSREVRERIDMVVADSDAELVGIKKVLRRAGLAQR